jgi:phi13 family phage major tail protein
MRQVGLKDITIAKLLTDVAGGTTTYDTPKKLERSIKASVQPKSNQLKTYSDDNVEEVLNTFDSIDVEIELNQLSLESRALLQGAKVVKGVLLETKNDIAPVVALGFKSKKTNGKYRYVWLYKGSFELCSDEYDTEEDQPKPSTATLKGTFYARESDGAFRLIADEDEVGIDAATITGWFTAVPNQPAAA